MSVGTYTSRSRAYSYISNPPAGDHFVISPIRVFSGWVMIALHSSDRPTYFSMALLQHPGRLECGYSERHSQILSLVD